MNFWKDFMNIFLLRFNISRRHGKSKLQLGKNHKLQ